MGLCRVLGRCDFVSDGVLGLVVVVIIGDGVVAAAIIIANWQTCDIKGTRGTGRGSRWCGGILRMGLKRGRGGETRPRASVLAGEEGGCDALVGDGGCGVRGRTELRGF